MPDLRNDLAAAIRRLNEQWNVAGLSVVSDETDIFGQVDSFAIVDLLLETEQVVEQRVGRYVPLAHESLFDAQHSPLRSFSDWVAHVDRTIHQRDRNG